MSDEKPKFVFVTCDFASMEARITANMNENPTERMVADCTQDDAKVSLRSLRALLAQNQPVCYLGHTYSSRETKD